MRRAWLLIVCGVVGGCAVPREVASPVAMPTIADAASVSVGPAEGLASSFTPIQAMDADYVRTGDGGPPRRVVMRIERPDEGEWAATIDGIGRAVYRLDDEGSVRVIREEDPRQNAAVTYDPGLVVLPARLTDDPVRGTSAATVHSLTNGRTRDRGTVRYETRVLGRGVIGIDGEPEEVVLVQMEREMDLGLADVTTESIRAWQEGRGVAAETARRTVRALGLLGRTSGHVQERAADAKVAPGNGR